MNKKIDLKYIILIVTIYGMVFQDVLVKYIDFFKFFDEFIAVFSILIAILQLQKNNYLIKIKKNNYKIITLIILIVTVGLLSNYIFKYQPIKIILSDLIIFLKFFLVYGMSNILWDKNFLEKYRKNLSTHIKLIIILFSILTLLNYTTNIFSSSIRFGIKVNKIFYNHPTTLVAMCTFLLSMLIRLEKKISYPITTIVMLILASTLRYKAIGAAVTILILIIYINKTNKKIKFSKFIVIGVLLSFLAFDQISYYFMNDETARNSLLIQSFAIAKDHFPLGGGFATYASYFSSVNYSILYVKYGLNNIYGLTYLNPKFISDSFWPMIIGQFGFIGLISYIYILKLIFVEIQNCYTIDNKYTYLSKIICFVYLIISSTSESAFVNPICLLLAIILGTEETTNLRKEIKNE